jgi:homoserine kinase
VFGGFTVSAASGAGFTTRSLALPSAWRYLFAVPPFELRTDAARNLLPAAYPRADVIHSTSRTALWAVAVATDDPALLKVASEDVLHQPYRAPLLPGLDATIRAALAAGAFAAYLSGAGPTLAAVCLAEDAAAVSQVLRHYAADTGQVLALRSAAGYSCEPAGTGPGCPAR